MPTNIAPQTASSTHKTTNYMRFALKTIATVAFTLATCGLCYATNTTSSDDEREKRVLDLSNFSIVAVEAPVNVTVCQADKFYVEMEATPKQFNRIEIAVEDGRLLITQKEGLWTRNRLIHVGWKKNFDDNAKIIVHMPQIVGLGVRSAGHIYVETPLHCEQLHIETSGASQIKLNQIETDFLRIETSGASIANLPKQVTTQEIEAQSSGSSQCIIDHLQTQQANVSASGASSIKLVGPNMGEMLTASVSGSASLRAANWACQRAKVTITGAAAASVNVNELLSGSASSASSITLYGKATTRVSVSGAASLSIKD